MSKDLPPSRTADQFVVRLPDGMRDRIAQAAKANNRSMNAEIVARLRTSFEPSPALTARESPRLGSGWPSDLAEGGATRAEMSASAAVWMQIRALERKRSLLEAQVALHREAIEKAHQAYRDADPAQADLKARLWDAVAAAEQPVEAAHAELRALGTRLNDLYDAVGGAAPGSPAGW